MHWTLICRVERASCEHKILLPNAALPEVREYRVVAVMNEVEVGNLSDPMQVILRAVWWRDRTGSNQWVSNWRATFSVAAADLLMTDLLFTDPSAFTGSLSARAGR